MSSSPSQLQQPQQQNQQVAIKLVGHPTSTSSSSTMDAFTQMSESGYFRRECEVLQEISHPLIVKLLHKIEEPVGDAGGGSSSSFAPGASPFCMVLEYCRGPTLEQMIKHGGALGIYMAREVAAQLVDAVSFLHGRGVIHRDIKPDNIVIAGARLEGMDACWSDNVEGEDAAKKHRWHIKLIDFGFARPLHPEDIEEDKLKNNNENKPEPKDEFFGRSDIDGALQNNRRPNVAKKQDSLSLSNSISHQKIRGLSAVGNRNYAAPEMLKGMRAFPKKLWMGLSSSTSGGKVEKELKKKRMHRQSLADAISDYGMTADAFSVGTTLRYMLTGVPPDVSINDFMASKNSVFSKVGRSLKSSFGKNKDGKKMKKRYKYTRELPTEASKVVLGLTHWNERSRTTVRSARNYEWIKSSYFMKDEKDPISSNEHHGKINFLKCALERRV